MKRSYLILIGIVALSLMVSFGSLTRGHVWPDDWAGYTLQAQGLLKGDLRTFIDQNRFSVEHSEIVIGPLAYPWGFPLMLAPVLAVCGLKPLCLKLINLPFFTLTLLIFYYYLARRLRERDALALTALFAFSPVMIAAHDLILSDLAFLFFFFLSVFLIDSLNNKNPPALGDLHGPMVLSLASGASIFMAFFIRTNGILLFGALIVVQFIAWREKRIALRDLVSPYLFFLVLAILSALIFPDGFGSYFDQFRSFTLNGFLVQAHDYLWIISGFFEPFVWKDVLYAVFAVFFCVGVFYLARREFHLIAAIVLTYIVYVIWPYWQGLRFFYPLIPLFLYFAYQGLARTFEKRWTFIPFMLIAILGFASLVISSLAAINNLQADRAINGPFDEYSDEVFTFVRKELPPDSLIAFSQPRTLRLIADRSGAVILDCANLDQVDYLILNKKREGMGDQISLNFVPACNPAIEPNPVFENKRFLVYPVSP